MVNKNERASVAGATATEAKIPSIDFGIREILRDYDTLIFGNCQEQSPLLDFLGVGRENARTASELSKAFGCKPRDVTLTIQALRLQGWPICSTVGGAPRGYFLASSAAELSSYCKELHSRVTNVQLTEAAVCSTLDKLRAAEGE